MTRRHAVIRRAGQQCDVTLGPEHADDSALRAVDRESNALPKPRRSVRDVDAKTAVQQLRMMAIDHLVGRETSSDKLINAGLDALLAGVDSPSLPLLAGLTRSEEPEAPALFDRVVDELELVPADLPVSPTPRAWALVRWWAQLIVDGTLTSATGGQLIWWHGWDLLNGPDEIRPLIESIILHDDEMSAWAIWDSDYVSRNRARSAEVIAQAQAFLSSTQVPET